MYPRLGSGSGSGPGLGARLHHDVPELHVLGGVEDVTDVAVALDPLHDEDLVAEVVPLLTRLEAHRLERSHLDG